MNKIFKKIKEKLEVSTKSCPDCREKLSKGAKICPECGSNLMKSKNSFFKTYKLDKNCCVTALLILIFVIWLVWKLPSLQYLFLAVILAVVILLIIILLMFGGLLYDLKNIFRF